MEYVYGFVWSYSLLQYNYSAEIEITMKDGGVKCPAK